MRGLKLTFFKMIDFFFKGCACPGEEISQSELGAET